MDHSYNNTHGAKNFTINLLKKFKPRSGRPGRKMNLAERGWLMRFVDSDGGRDPCVPELEGPEVFFFFLLRKYDDNPLHSIN